MLRLVVAIFIFPQISVGNEAQPQRFDLLPVGESGSEEALVMASDDPQYRLELACATAVGRISHSGLYAFHRIGDSSSHMPSGQMLVAFAGRHEGQQGVFVAGERFYEFVSFQETSLIDNGGNYRRDVIYHTPEGVGENRSLYLGVFFDQPAASVEQWSVSGRNMSHLPNPHSDFVILKACRSQSISSGRL
ncbi:MAG: hypothetical protein AAF202_06155 [Pseudomonadota bacterium]